MAFAPITSVSARRLSAAALSADVATPLAEQPQYRHVGGQRFLPANDAAREECRRWNAWADEVMARTARSVDQ